MSIKRARHGTPQKDRKTEQEANRAPHSQRAKKQKTETTQSAELERRKKVVNECECAQAQVEERDEKGSEFASE